MDEECVTIPLRPDRAIYVIVAGVVALAIKVATRAARVSRMGRLRIAAAALMLSASPAIASDCLIDPANVPDAPRFANWPATPGRSVAPAAPVLASRAARRFRTALWDGAAAGPNFAGHFTIVVWGCGASCTTAAVMDARSGRVSFPTMLRAISAVHVADPADPGPNSLRFRRDSRLLVVLGAPGEDETKEGVTYLEWTGTALRPLRFLPRSRLCE